MEFFDAKFISVTTVGLSTIALLLNLLVLAVILSDKSLRTNACFRIICALVICGAVSVTSHIAHNTTILLDKTEHVAFNTVLGAITYITGYLRSPADMLLAVNRLITVMYLTQITGRARKIFDMLLLVSWVFAFVTLAVLLLAPFCDARFLDRVWAPSECWVNTFNYFTHAAYLYPLLVGTFVSNFLTFGLLVMKRKSLQFASFRSTFEWSILAITCVDFSLAASVVTLTRIFPTRAGGSGTVTLIVSVLAISVNITCPVSLLVFNRSFRKRSFSIVLCRLISGNGATPVGLNGQNLMKAVGPL